MAHGGAPADPRRTTTARRTLIFYARKGQSAVIAPKATVDFVTTGQMPPEALTQYFWQPKNATVPNYEITGDSDAVAEGAFDAQLNAEGACDLMFPQPGRGMLTLRKLFDCLDQIQAEAPYDIVHCHFCLGGADAPDVSVGRPTPVPLPRPPGV